MYGEEDSKPEAGSFAIFFAEGESLAKQGEFNKAIESFTKALEFQAGERSCLVARSKCYLQLGDSSAALKDAEESLKEDKKYHRGLFQKAEALYQMGDFEYALVYYHRGYKLRPELNEFKLGIQKAQEAIQNSIGTPEQCKLELIGDLTHFTKQAEMAKKKKVKKSVLRPIGQLTTTQQKKRERKPVASDKTVKELLGELYADKQYLEGLLNDKNLTIGKSDTSILDKVHTELEYLDGRVEFWRQQKPMYARKREKELKRVKPEPTKPIGMSLRPAATTNNHVKYIIKSLKDIDSAIEAGEFDVAIQQGQNVIQTVDSLSETDLPSKAHFVATVHSCIGTAFLEKGEAEKALEHHLKDYAISKEIGVEEGRTRSLDNLVKVYIVLGEYEEALQHLNERSPLISTKEEAIWVNHEMGTCFFELGQFEKARSVGEKAMTESGEAKDMTWYLNASVLVARSEAKLNDLSSAVQSYERSLEIAKIVNDEFAEDAITKALTELNQKIIDQLQVKESSADEDKGDTEQDTSEGPAAVEVGEPEETAEVERVNESNEEGSPMHSPLEETV